MLNSQLLKVIYFTFITLCIPYFNTINAQPAPPFECGELTFSCFSGWTTPWGGINDPTDPTIVDDNYVMAVADVNNHSTAPLGANWTGAYPMYHHNDWKSNKMGQIFGQTIDGARNIYATSTTIYSQLPPGSLGGPGSVYKIDANTGNVSLFATLPNALTANGNTKYGLGNISFNNVNFVFYVSNMMDGKIYCLDNSGAIIDVFDPALNDPATIGQGFYDNGSPGYIPLSQTIWAVGYKNDKLYFGVWGSTSHNEIWSVDIDPSNGKFVGGLNPNGDKFDNAVMERSFLSNSNAISDFDFSQGGDLVIGTRTAYSIYQTNAHSSPVFKLPLNNLGAGVLQQYYIGSYGSHTNGAGGVAVGYGSYDPTIGGVRTCDQMIWSTGDALIFSWPDYIYGFSGIPFSGNSVSNVGTTSIYVDADGNTSNSYVKNFFGDIEMFKCDCQFEGESTLCEGISATNHPIQGDSCCFEIAIDNTILNGFTYVELQTQGGTSISSFSAQNGWLPQSYTATNLLMIDPSGNVPVGNTIMAEICLSQFISGPQEVLVNYYDGKFDYVCTDTLSADCSQAPSCMSIVNDSIYCGNEFGTFGYEFCVEIDPNIDFNVNAFVLNPPTGVTMTPNVFPVGNLSPGTTDCSFTTVISGNFNLIPDSLCFSVTAHDVDISGQIIPTSCCTDTVDLVCLALPDCNPCNDLSVTSTYDNTQAGCCWSINLSNNFNSNLFTEIITEVITPGVHISSVNNTIGSGWLMNDQAPYSNTYTSWKPFTPSGSFIGASEQLPIICLSGIDTTSIPQVVVVHWLAGAETVCTDTLYFDCQPDVVPEDCAIITDTSLVCGQNPGEYVFTFSVINLTNHSIQNVDLTGLLPFTASFSPSNFNITIPAGDTLTNLTTILNYSGNISPCFTVTLHEIDANGNNLNCCTQNASFCLNLPSCSTGDCCDNYEDFIHDINGVFTTETHPSCGQVCYDLPQSDCSAYYIDWGDNGTADTLNSGSICHTYNTTSNEWFNVCLTAIQYNSVGQICNETIQCDSTIIKACSDCTCNGFGHLFVYEDVAASPDTSNLICGDTLTLEGCVDKDEILKFEGRLDCDANCQDRSLNYSMIQNGVQIFNGTGTISGNIFTFDFQTNWIAVDGYHELELTGVCGGDTCICVIPFEVSGCTDTTACCENAEFLFDDINQIFSTVDDSICGRLLFEIVSDSCETVFQFNWGDGSAVETQNSGAIDHTFGNSQDAWFNVCVSALQYDNQEVCSQASRCDSILVPGCAVTCTCNGFTDLVVYDKIDLDSVDLACGDTLVIEGCVDENLPLVFEGIFNCAGNCENQRLNYTLFQNGVYYGNSIANLSGSNFTFDWSSNFLAENGTHTIQLEGICGADTCICVIPFEVSGCNADACCDVYDDFLNKVEDVLIAQTHPSCGQVCYELPVDDCTEFNFDWGDGSVEYQNSGQICHDYGVTSNQAFNVCIEAFQFNDDGKICNETKQCDSTYVKGCEVACSCGKFFDIQAKLDGTDEQYKFDCGGEFELKCLKPDSKLIFNSRFECEGDCAMQHHTWVLSKDGVEIDHGGMNIFGNPMNVGFAINTDNLQASGVYEIELSGQCGDETCTCAFKIIIPEGCGCLCDNLEADVNYGFTVANLLDDQDCKKTLYASHLQACDKVNWIIEGEDGVVAELEGTPIDFLFENDHKYNITMIVIRTDANGVQCEAKYSEVIYVECGKTDTGCIGSVLNSGFLGGLDNWVSIFGNPEVSDENGYLDDNEVILTGNNIFHDKLGQNINLQPTEGKDYQISCAIRPVHFIEGTSFVLLASKKVLEPNSPCLDCYEIGSFELDPDHKAYSNESFYLSGKSEIKGIVLSVRNKDNALVSKIGVDNICIELVDKVTIGTQDLGANQIVNIYPNPASNLINIHFENPIKRPMKLKVYNVTGKIIYVSSFPKNTQNHAVDVRQLPSGVYFLDGVDESGNYFKELFVIK